MDKRLQKYFIEGGVGAKLCAADHPENAVRELIRGENARQLSLFDDTDVGAAPLAAPRLTKR